MDRVVYIMPLLGSLAGTLTLLGTWLTATTAPQEAAGFAMACALAIVPYVFARSIAFMNDERESRGKRDTAALEKLASRLAPDTAN